MFCTPRSRTSCSSSSSRFSRQWLSTSASRNRRSKPSSDGSMQRIVSSAQHSTTTRGRLGETIGLRTWFLVLPFAVGGALIGMYFLPLLALPTFLLIRGVSDVTRSFAGQYINDHAETLGRATVLSAMAMVSGLAVVPFQLGSGIISDVVSPLFAPGCRWRCSHRRGSDHPPVGGPYQRRISLTLRLMMIDPQL